MRSQAFAARPDVSDRLLVPPAALHQDGAFTRAQARRAGFTDDRQRRLLARGEWTPIAGPVLRHAEVPMGPWLQARAVSLLGRWVASHSTAALLWGWSAPAGLHGIRTVGRPSPSLVSHHLPLAGSDVFEVAGIRVTTPERTLADLLCWLAEEPAVQLVTDAFRRGLLEPSDLVVAARSVRGRTGASRARSLALSCAGRPFSVLEWRFHAIACRVADGWRFNVQLTGPGGHTLVVDALHEASGLVVELDGRRHHGDDRFQADRTRDQLLAVLGYRVLRFTWDDVVHRPERVAEILRIVIDAEARRSA